MVLSNKHTSNYERYDRMNISLKQLSEQDIPHIPYTYFYAFFIRRYAEIIHEFCDSLNPGPSFTICRRAETMTHLFFQDSTVSFVDMDILANYDN